MRALYSEWKCELMQERKKNKWISVSSKKLQLLVGKFDSGYVQMIYSFIIMKY